MQGVRKVSELILINGRSLIVTETNNTLIDWDDIPVGTLRVNPVSGAIYEKLIGHADWVAMTDTAQIKTITDSLMAHIANKDNPHEVTLADVGGAPAAHVGSGGDAHADATTTTDGFMTAAMVAKLSGVATGANNYVHPNHTGDVTSDHDGATTIAAGAVNEAKLAANSVSTGKIQNGAVTLDKMASMATDSFLGRDTTGAGAPEVIGAAAAKVILGLNNVTNVEAIPLSYLEVSDTLASNDDTHVPTTNSVKAYADTKIAASYLDTDGTLAANSDVKIATQKAVKTYVGSKIAEIPVVVFGSGSLANGQTIPLPSGCTQEQCIWGVNGVTPEEYIDGIQKVPLFNTSYGQYWYVTSVNSSRVITAKAFYDYSVGGENPEDISGFIPVAAEYWIIGVK